MFELFHTFFTAPTDYSTDFLLFLSVSICCLVLQSIFKIFNGNRLHLYVIYRIMNQVIKFKMFCHKSVQLGSIYFLPVYKYHCFYVVYICKKWDFLLVFLQLLGEVMSAVNDSYHGGRKNPTVEKLFLNSYDVS